MLVHDRKDAKHLRGGAIAAQPKIPQGFAIAVIPARSFSGIFDRRVLAAILYSGSRFLDRKRWFS